MLVVARLIFGVMAFAGIVSILAICVTKINGMIVNLKTARAESPIPNRAVRKGCYIDDI